MINNVILTGRLTKDAELYVSQTGTNTAFFTLAVDYGKDKEASFIPCKAFDGIAQTLIKYTRKGDLIAIVGRLSQRKYTSKDGVNKSVFEVIVNTLELLEPKKEESVKTIENDLPKQVVAEVDSSTEDDDLPF